MNILTIVVLGVIALCAYGGYRQGFLRVAYSLAGWVLVLGIVTFSSPYITRFLEENTKIQDTIKEKCLEHLKESKESAREEAQSSKEDDKRDKAAPFQNSLLPEAVMEDIVQSAAYGAGELLESSGVYENIADSVSGFVLEGISFFAAFVLASILVRCLAGVLDIVSHLPVVKDVNKALGVMAGGIKGLLIVWLAFYLLAVCITSELGREIYAFVEESPVLLFLYDNNILLELILLFF